MGNYGIGKQSSDAPTSQQSEEYGKDIQRADESAASSIGEASSSSEGVTTPFKPEAPAKLETSKYGDPNAGLHGQAMAALTHLAAGKLDNTFYGHTLPEHFKKTNIISTSGRVR